VRERDPVHEWSPYDEPEVDGALRQLVLARLADGEEHARTRALRARLEEAVQEAEAAAA
jgi:hypothetical protein